MLSKASQNAEHEDTDASCARLALITMIKDEAALLPTWIDYHLSLFAPSSIHILDNGSSDPDCLATLDEARSRGVTVIDAPGADAFRAKGDKILEVARDLQNSFDWFIPLDGDEFLAIMTRDGVEASRATFAAEFRLLNADGRKVARVTRSLWNRPNTTTAYRCGIQKVILSSGHGLDTLDLGFHLWNWQENKSTIPETDIVPSNICYLHFHNRPYIDLLQSARKKLAGRVPDFRRRTLENYRGNGEHLTNYFLMSEEEYLQNLPQGSTEIGALFAERGLAVPFSEPRRDREELALVAARSPVNLATYEGLLAMTPREVQALATEMVVCDRYVEYGAGGSTLLACELGVQFVHSIETSLDHCVAILGKHALDKYVLTGRLKLTHVDIGETGSWGYPSGEPSSSKRQIYIQAHSEHDKVDLALIDGRYRVACAAALLLRDKPPNRIAWHDYFSRSHYHGLSKYLGNTHRVDDLLLFEPNVREHDKDEIREVLSRHVNDPR